MPKINRNKRKEELINIFFMIASFIVALNLYNLFRYFGLEEMDKIPQIPISFTEITFNAFFGGIIVGTILGILDNVLNRQNIRQKSFGVVLTLKTFSFLLTFFLTISVVFLTTHTLLNKEPFQQAFSELLIFYTEKTFFAILVYGLVVIFFINLVKLINRKMGPGILIKFISGRYHKPREEERIFMFLDLKSSTTIAEKLGHFKFSRLIQDCFYDLTDFVKNYNAEIYQYVGDEAVITWKLKNGLIDDNCIHFYFAYKEQLLRRSEYYEKSYGLVPQFKAGINCGKVTVAEVGEVKTEIAYHGDVLNTTARIQSMCNVFGKELLISEFLKDELDLNEFNVNNMGEIMLKGKIKPVTIYSIEQK